VARLLLVHGLGPFNTGLWNTPSWSISTEFFAYLAFAAAVSVCGRRLRAIVVALVMLLPLALYIRIGRIDAAGYEMVRCLYGFAAGVATWHVYQRLRTAGAPGTLAEMIVIAAAVAIVAAGGGSGWSIGAPFVFAALVLVFAWESGAASRVLKSKPFIFLGTVSYSIYMVHLFVAGRIADGLRLASAQGIFPGDSLGSSRWTGDLLVVVSLAIVVAAAALTYRLIEAPGREWSRRLAQRPMVRTAA
jgi:peptidoglycan/LPS O-acetylase OafA/YrhL